MAPLIFALPGNEASAHRFAEALGAEMGRWTPHRFPDGEFYVRVESSVRGRVVLLFSSLKDPDTKTLPLIFLSSTLRDLGAKKIILVAPYLAYLRQDARFQEGEGVTSRYFADLLSKFLDGMTTVAPHLHRYASLNEIYSIPTRVAHAAPKISEWIRTTVSRPLIIGPDSESEQWVSEVAQLAEAPSLVLEKMRRGDRKVEIHFPPLDRWQNHTPVIVDDIIASAGTMIAIVEHLRKAAFSSAICVGVHGIFTRNAYEGLIAAGATKVVTCNTIPHFSAQIDLSDLLAEQTKELLVAADS